MLKKSWVVAVLMLVVLATGCMTHAHTIGAGPAGVDTAQARQWYVLWGLVPINTVDTQTMAAGAANYEIQTQHSVLDVIINIFTGWITVYSRTVTVTR